MGLLDGKVAIVTGAGRGIGRGEAIELAAQGASVVVGEVDAEAGQSVVDEIIAIGGAAGVPPRGRPGNDGTPGHGPDGDTPVRPGGAPGHKPRKPRRPAPPP